MSDVERPDENPEFPRARNMADIARLFLDGARPTAPGSKPRRVPPTSMAQRRETPAPAPVPTPASAPAPDPSAVRLAISGNIDNWTALLAAAAGIADEQSTTVGLLGFTDNQFVIDVVGAESAADLPAVRLDAASGGFDLQIARALFTLRGAVGAWIIAAPAAGTAEFAALAGRIAGWLVVCPTDNQGLVAAYQHLKRASVAPCAGRTVQAFMVGEDCAQAAVVHGRLRRAAQEFLGTDLPLIAVGGLSAATPVRVAVIAVEDAAAVWTAVLDELAPAASEPELEEEPTAEAEVPEELPEPPLPEPQAEVEAAVDRVAATAAHIAKSAEEVFDQLAHVLDPEERAALGADFDPPAFFTAPSVVAPPEIDEPVRMPVRDMKPAASKAPIAAQTLPARAPSPADLVGSPSGTGTLVLRAFDLLDAEVQDRSAQWQAVERSIRDFVPGATLLDARPPMAWAKESSLAVDSEGRLHVWTLFRDGASWFALREWAIEHRGLVALTRRDLPIKQDAEVAVHIVMPLDNGAGRGQRGESLSRAGGLHVSWYRLRAVQWAGRRGALVVPAE
jgi:hypothetical protein